MSPRRILLTGATGYVGGRLAPRLLERGYAVRVLTRDPDRLAARPWREQVEVVHGDMGDPESLRRALQGTEVAYYLVHSMQAGADFAARDRQYAHHFVQAGREAGLQHLIYLGGLLPKEGAPSLHLSSRAEVGAILREGLPCTEFRAGPIIGSGSASFEMARYLTERLPVMLTPRWIDNRVSPIGVRDVLHYLLQAAERAPLGVVEIGATPLTFREMMQIYANERGLRRVIVKTPVLAPKLAALWVGLVTPIPNRLAVPLVEGIVHALVADTARARALFPAIEPMDYRAAVRLALTRISERAVETHWSGALGAAQTYTLEDWEGLICEERTALVDAPPETVFRAFCSLGGETGWLAWNWAWRLRGLLDKLVGGPGLRRGRRHPYELLPGEALDFWRVEQVVPNRSLRLRAEMKTPGKAWLEFQAIPEGGRTRLVQRALFEPRGLPGALYWYALYPIHKLIFSDMARALAQRAERLHLSAPAPHA
ncbi:MAG: SDR family oxidoreductase [Fimbriimonadales bacterium]|nr:SDR family oxidoreductase [Fimbriimonadales bacterium]